MDTNISDFLMNTDAAQGQRRSRPDQLCESELIHCFLSTACFPELLFFSILFLIPGYFHLWPSIRFLLQRCSGAAEALTGRPPGIIASQRRVEANVLAQHSWRAARRGPGGKTQDAWRRRLRCSKSGGPLPLPLSGTCRANGGATTGGSWCNRCPVGPHKASPHSQ